MAANTSNFYQVGASLPVNAPSYVNRKADDEFYQTLKAGKFCYVLNSRQMGKSSLRVQTMQRLQNEGIVCAAIDLTGIGKYKVTREQWYGGIVYALVESCQLEDKFDFDWQIWWQKYQELLDPVMCLRLFIEQVLLVKIQQQIIIFVDEIDRVLSQDFSLDDFFALIRFFQNQRVDNPIFERLTFALLGVATPSDLITDKTQTPFNIGEGIELHGFQINEVQNLIEGLPKKLNHPQKVMAEIIDWTGGQPFLTQKLCQLMVEESAKDHPRSVEDVVKSRIIENWESQDDPEHLRTIRDRILSNEQRADYLLELYQKIQKSGEIATSNSLEISQLQLSGLIVKRQSKLLIYNRIYQQVFNEKWIENQLKNLRPYSENFRAWVASGYNDESRLLRGQALQDAEEWANGKNLNYQDKQFLAASKQKEIEAAIAEQEKEAQLEREKKDKEAVKKRNQVLTNANQQANRRIRNGSIIFIITLLIALIAGFMAIEEGKKALNSQKQAKEAQKNETIANRKTNQAKEREKQANKNVLQIQKNLSKMHNQLKLAIKKEQNLKDNLKKKISQIKIANNQLTLATQKTLQSELKLQKTQLELTNVEEERKKAIIAKEELAKDIDTVKSLTKLAGALQSNSLSFESEEALRQAGLSFKIEDHKLKQAFLLASMSLAHQNLKEWKAANTTIYQSLNILFSKYNLNLSAEQLQVIVIAKTIQGKLIEKEGNRARATETYQEAFNIFNNYQSQTNPFINHKTQIITAKDVELLHISLIKLLSLDNSQNNIQNYIKQSLKNHYFKELNYVIVDNNEKQWKYANQLTIKIISFLSKSTLNEETYTLVDAPFGTLSCEDIYTINNTWIRSSNSRFSFSIQKNTLKNMGWKVNDLNNQIWLNFFKQIGWLDKEENLSLGEFRYPTYSINAKEGNLPFIGDSDGLISSVTSYKGLLSKFFSETDRCKL